MAALSFNGNMLAYNGYALYAGAWPGPGLPPYTIKLQYSVGETPKFKKGTATQLYTDPNIWLLTYKNRYWGSLLGAIDQGATLLSVPEANTTGVMDMTEMFAGCYKVEGGALALYQQARYQTTPPSSHDGTFRNCGVYTETGYTEYVQIPNTWK